MKTKIFCDIAELDKIKKFNKKKIVKGFTTNPSLMRKAGAKDYTKYSKDILAITNKPVSCEVFADDIKNMIVQGNKISNWGKNIYVKVPVTNSKGKFMGKIIKELWWHMDMQRRGVKKELRSPYNRRKDLNVEVKDVIGFQNSNIGYPIWLKVVTENGEDAIAEMYLLSKCDYLLHNASGFAHVALLLNSGMNHVDSQRPGGKETLDKMKDII